MSLTSLLSQTRSVQPGKIKNGFIVFILFILTTAFLAWGIRWATQGNTLGIDFFIYYTAGRGVFIEKLSPYDPRLVDETQMGIYGHLVPPDKDQMAFVYPAFALFPFIPLIWLDFPTAQAIWMAFNLVLVILTWFLLMPQSPRWMPMSLLLFYPIVFALVLGNINISAGVALMVFLCLFVLRKTPSISLQIVSGLLLSWAMVKPQLTWLFLILAALIILRDRLWALLISLAASFGALVALSFVVFPVDWPLQWLSRARTYTGYVQTQSVINSFLSVLLPANLALYLTILVIILSGAFTILIFVNWWVQNNHAHRLPSFLTNSLQKNLHISITDLQLLAWIGFFTYLVHPSHTSYEQISILIPFSLWAASRWRVEKRTPRFFWLAGLVISWLAAVIDLLKWSPASIYGLPVLFYALWITYIFKPNLLPARQRITHAPA